MAKYFAELLAGVAHLNDARVTMRWCDSRLLSTEGHATVRRRYLMRQTPLSRLSGLRERIRVSEGAIR